jgi:hypothetical protein
LEFTFTIISILSFSLSFSIEVGELTVDKLKKGLEDGEELGKISSIFLKEEEDECGVCNDDRCCEEGENKDVLEEGRLNEGREF